MNHIIKNTFGGMNTQLYVRHLLFGSLFAIFPLYVIFTSDQSIRIDQIAYFVVNTVLYSYSRFAYESLLDAILGKNVFFVNALLMLIVKFVTMLLCWGLAIFIAPIGLAYLYYLNTRKQSL